MGKRAAIDMSKMEVPTVEEAIHLGDHAKENGEVMVNGSANGSATGKANGRATRSRKA